MLWLLAPTKKQHFSIVDRSEVVELGIQDRTRPTTSTLKQRRGQMRQRTIASKVLFPQASEVAELDVPQQREVTRQDLLRMELEVG